MKKLILILSFLASQLLAEQCTEQQYKPYFDKNSDRYMNSYWQSHDLSPVVIDKESIVYDKKSQKVICWLLYQTRDTPDYGVIKVKREFDFNNKKVRQHSVLVSACNGTSLGASNTIGEWGEIPPESGNELALNSLKKYLNIK